MESYVRKAPPASAALRGEIALTLTERCNNNCAHCCISVPAGCASAKKKELSTDDVLAIMREAASLGFLTVRFTGGEPLLRDDFAELYVGVRRMGMRVLIFTNATLVTPGLADLFARMPPMEDIEVTLYGMHQESYEAASRTRGSFQAAWRGIHLLLERNIPIYVKGAMLPGNLNEIDEFREWVKTAHGTTKPPVYSMNFTLRCRRDSERKNDLIRKVRLSPAATVSVLGMREKEYLTAMAQFAQKFMRPPGNQVFGCTPKVSIDPYGYAFPCTELRCPDTAYDLRAGSIEDAIESFHPQLRALRSSNPAYLSRCARCFLKAMCEQCPSRSWAEHGTLDTPVEYFCEVAHCRARHLGLLADSERAWEVEDWEDRVQGLTQRAALDSSATA